MKKSTTSLLSALLVAGAAISLVDPFMWWMPTPMVFTMMALLLVASLVHGAFWLRERAADEREERHVMSAGRVAFLSGIAVAVLGILVQAIVLHQVSGWLVAVVVVMVISKQLTRLYLEHNG